MFAFLFFDLILFDACFADDKISARADQLAVSYSPGGWEHLKALQLFLKSTLEREKINKCENECPEQREEKKFIECFLIKS